jgi:hypothetical protein
MRPLPLLAVVRLLVLVLVVSVSARASAQLSEADRKAAARSAYTEGVKLQEDGKPADALSRFESAEKLYDAPTHLLHIAQCQAATGKLVEAAETYEVLTHKSLGTNPPEAFADAQKKGESELKDLRARIPTLRLTVKPAPQSLRSLQVTLNGKPMPNELLDIARPVNPGTYHINAGATGYKLAAPLDLTLAEREQKAQELQLVPGQPPAVVVTPAPVPQPYATGAAPPPPPPPYYQAGPPPGQEPKPAPPAKPQPSSLGLLLGLHLGLVVPGGGALATTTTVGTITTKTDVNMSDYTAPGGGGGIDAALRFARILYAGGLFEYATLGSPDSNSTAFGAASSNVKVTSHTSYVGAVLGIVPNIERTSFIADIGVGHRSFTAKATGTGAAGFSIDDTLSGTEFAVGAGISIPAGPIRLVPKATINAGAFTSQTCTGVKCDSSIPNTATHVFVFVGLTGYYHLDLAKK